MTRIEAKKKSCSVNSGARAFLYKLRCSCSMSFCARETSRICHSFRRYNFEVASVLRESFIDVLEVLGDDVRFKCGSFQLYASKMWKFILTCIYLTLHISFLYIFLLRIGIHTNSISYPLSK